MTSVKEGQQTPPLDLLIESHDRFLNFLAGRLRSREAAEDVLQRAYVTGVERAGSVRDPERIVAWFYRLLRNAITGHFRHAAAEKRALQRVAGEVMGQRSFEPELEKRICACVNRLLGDLRPQYAEVVRAVDLGGSEIADVARDLEITPNNVRVRLHRARRTLRRRLLQTCAVCAEHGCLDCSCRPPDGAVDFAPHRPGEGTRDE
jgi:RNA polymerase sigma-70 factor (ECF subfamily)